MTHSSRSLSAFGWRCARLTLVALAIGFGGWQAGQWEWSAPGRALDEALWSHALKDRSAATDLRMATPVWRERKGASGDKIVERVELEDTAPSAVAVLDDVSGQALSAPVLAEQAAERKDTALPVKPAHFAGLAAGDRLTITTTSGEIYSFEVVAARDETSDRGKIAIRVMTPDGEQGPVLYAVRPAAPGNAANIQPQQDL